MCGFAKVYKSPAGAHFMSYVKAKEHWEARGTGIGSGTRKLKKLKRRHADQMQAPTDAKRDLADAPTLESAVAWLRNMARASTFGQARLHLPLRKSLLNARAAIAVRRPRT